jgi:hypothetical protein
MRLRHSLAELNIFSEKISLVIGLEPFLVRLQHSAGAGFRQGRDGLAKGIPLGTFEPIAFDPGAKMPGPPAALLRHAKQ